MIYITYITHITHAAMCCISCNHLRFKRLCIRYYANVYINFLNNNKFKKGVVSMKTLKRAKVGETVKVVKLTGRAQSRAVSWIWELQKVLKFT